MPKASGDTGVSRGRLGLYHLVLAAAVFGGWYLLTEPILWSPEFA